MVMHRAKTKSKREREREGFVDAKFFVVFLNLI